MSTQYTLVVNGTPTDFTRSTKATVVAEAEKRRIAEKAAVTVVTNSGTPVFELAAPPVRRAYTHPKPDTRLVAVPDGVELAEGWVAAYDRVRRGALVLRNETAEKGAEDKFAVLDISTGDIVGYAPTTRGAGQIMLAMAKVAKAG